MRTRPRSLVALGLGSAVLALATASHAGEVVIRGTLDVKGTRWENGVTTRVSCSSSGGGFMNAGPTLRLLAVAPSDKCTITGDGEGLPPSPFGAFRFVGTTQQVTDRGKVKPLSVYAALPASPGVEGLMIGLIKVDRAGRPVSEKGTVIYRREIGDRVIHFHGTYRSKLRRR